MDAWGFLMVLPSTFQLSSQLRLFAIQQVKNISTGIQKAHIGKAVLPLTFKHKKRMKNWKMLIPINQPTAHNVNFGWATFSRVCYIIESKFTIVLMMIHLIVEPESLFVLENRIQTRAESNMIEIKAASFRWGGIIGLRLADLLMQPSEN